MLTDKVKAAAKVSAGGGSFTEYIAVGFGTSPWIRVYPFSTATGFGTAFSNPATLPTTEPDDIRFSPSGDAIFLPESTCTAYRWSTAGWGTRYTNAVGVNYGNAVDVTTAGTQVAFGNDQGAFIHTYPWTYASGFGTKYANPSTLLPSSNFVQGIAFSYAGDAVAVATLNTPYINAYVWTASGFGSKFANPGTLPPNSARGIAFNPNGTAIAVVHFISPFVTAYPWSGSGFGTKFANAASPPTNTMTGCEFSSTGDVLVIAGSGSPYMHAYAWSSSGFGTRYSNPGTIPTGVQSQVTFNADSTAIAVVGDGTPFVRVYPWSAAAGFGTKYADPSVAIPTGAASVAFGRIAA